MLIAAAVLPGCGGGGTSPAPAPPTPPLLPGTEFVTSAPEFRASAPTPYAAACHGTNAPGALFANTEVEPHVAVNPRNPDNLIGAWQQDRWSGGAARGIVLAVSQDGARAWSRLALPLSRCGGVTEDRATDP